VVTHLRPVNKLVFIDLIKDQVTRILSMDLTKYPKADVEEDQLLPKEKGDEIQTTQTDGLPVVGHPFTLEQLSALRRENVDPLTPVGEDGKKALGSSTETEEINDLEQREDEKEAEHDK
jgi:hypothetical protein